MLIITWINLPCQLRKEVITIAYINGKWLNRKDRQELIDANNELLNALLDKEESKGLSLDEYEELDQIVQLLERLNRIHRSEVDLLYFAWEYFSESRNPENSGNWDGFHLDTPEDAPHFHKEICAIMDHVSNVEKNAKTATAAPRSHAKSSYLAKANPLREIVFRKRKFIVLFSETPTVAMGNLDWIAWQLKGNKKLREDFGELLSPKQQLNPKDNQVEFITWTGDNDNKKMHTYVKSLSSNQACRGLNWLGTRVDAVICDDLEGIHTNAGTPEQRAKLREWFSSDVLPLGDVKGEKISFTYMGTIVHQDSLLNTVINDNPDFKSVKFKAIIEEPERMDLWEQCRSIYLDKNLTKEERKAQAEQYYSDHQEEMDKGCIVLWKEAQPIFKLLTWKWTYGSKAFNTEYQNEPRDEESQIFVPEKFSKFKEADLEGQPLEYYAFWDVATGKNIKRTDYNAIITIAKNTRTGIVYVIDTWGAKCKLDEALQVAVNKIEMYPYKVFGVETIGISFDAGRQLKEALRKVGLFTRIKEVSSHKIKDKDIRIASMEPLVESGFLCFRDNQGLLFEQMEQFPSGSNDDLPDSLASALELAGGVGKRNRTYRSKPKGW